jgi:hypothetical protein
MNDDVVLLILKGIVDSGLDKREEYPYNPVSLERHALQERQQNAVYARL